MVRAAVERSEQLLLRMHEADFGGNETRDVTGASPFIAEFVRFLGHSRLHQCLLQNSWINLFRSNNTLISH